MPAGIRAELAFEDPKACRIAGLLDETAEATSISWSFAPESGRITEEFAIDGDHDDVSAPNDIESLSKVFSYGSRSIYRFQRNGDGYCPCEAVQAFDVPLRDIHTEEGALHLAIYVEDMDELRDILDGVQPNFPDMRVVRLVQSQESGEGDLVLIDRGELTSRQKEVLETAHAKGYFTHPKGANAGEIAEKLDITTSTFTEHLAAAQSKLLDSILY